MNKITKHVVYTSDRNEQFEVTEMQSSHLINVLHLHQQQIKTLNMLRKRYEKGEEGPMQPEYDYMNKRIAHLVEVCTLLCDELASRDPEKDHVGQPRRQKYNDTL